MLSLNCLNDEEGATAAKRHLITNAAGLIQHTYFENALISKFKSKDMLLWRRNFAFVSTENERLWIYFGLRKIRFDRGRKLSVKNFQREQMAQRIQYLRAPLL